MPKTSKQQPVSRVLIVDDDPVMRLLMHETLASEDIIVEEAEDGLSSLATFEQFHPHLVLLDVRMPKMDGFAVCAEIRRHPEGENVTIVMVTSLDDYSSIEQAYQAGATDFITKPITWPVFNHRIRHLLQAGEAFAVVRQSRIELELKERLLREAQHIGHMGNWSWDIASGDLTWSDEIFHIFGHEPGSFEPSYERFLTAVYPQDIEFIEQSVKSLSEPEGSYSIDYRITLPDGQIHWVHEEAIGKFDDDNNLLNVQGTVQDITERKQGDEALRQSEKELRDIIDNMVDVFYRTDTEGKIVMLSPSVEEQTGWKPGELIGKNMADFYIDPHGREKFLKILSESGGKVIGYEAQLRHRDNSEKWVSNTARYYYDEHGKIAGVEGMARDITAQKRLLASQERLAEILEATPDLVGTMDMSQRILYLNSSARRVLGLKTANDIVNLNLSGIHPSSTYKRLIKEIIPAVISNGTWSGENTVLALDGLEIPVWQTLIAHQTHDKEITYISFVMKDITDLLKKEAQLLHDQKLSAVGQLTSGIAHDFGNLLTILKGNLQFLDEILRKRGDKEVNELLDDARSAAEDGSQLTRQLLAFSRKEPTAPKHLAAQEAIRKFRGLIKRSLSDNIKLSIRAEKNLPDILVDSGQFESTLLNLVLNARDAMPDGGSLTIKTGQRVIDTNSGIEYAELEPGNYISITVTDTGVGMNKEVLNMACDPFFTTKTSEKGTGLGLSMVYGFIKQSGGKLLIDSTPGQGTSVTLLLLAHTDLKEEANDETSARTITSNSETVLVVEDREAVRRFARRSLEKLGYKVLEAENAKAARRILKQSSSIDLIFSDILMPGKMNGRELAKWVSQHFPRLKVLLTTAAEHETARSLEDTGTFPLLEKPYSREELAEKLKGIL